MKSLRLLAFAALAFLTAGAVTISNLPDNPGLTTAAKVEVSQNGSSYRATVAEWNALLTANVDAAVTSAQTAATTATTQATAAAASATAAAASAAEIGTLGQSLPRLVAWDTGSAVYVRMAWDSTYDLVVKLVRDSGTNSHNMNFQELGILLKTTASAGTPTLTSLESFTDDTTGLATAANGRFGGNHLAETVEITKAGHGLTSAAIGKRFDDTNSREYAITRILSSSVIEVIPEPATSVGDSTGTKTLPPASTTLTGLDGLSNLTGWTAAYAAAGPGANGLVQHILLDGAPLIPYGPALSGSKLEIVEYHQAPNLKGAFAYFTATGSTATWAAAGKMWDRVTRHTLLPWGQMEIEDSFMIAYATRFNEANPCQFNPLLGLTGAQNLHMWMPGSDSIVATSRVVNGVTSPTLDFNTPSYFGSGSGANIEWNTLADSRMAVFPDFFIQLCSPTTNSHTGWTSSAFVALDPTYANGEQTLRQANTKEFCNIAPGTRKVYFPQCVSLDSAIAAGTSFSFRAMRRWMPPPASSPVDYWTYVRAGEKWLVYVAHTANGGAATITLPSFLANRPATLVRGYNASLTTATSAGAALTVTPSAAAWHAIIQLN